jgi:hypothetical protein
MERENDRGDLKSALNALGIVEAILFGLAWVAWGVYTFCQVYAGEMENHRRIDLIRNGEVVPIPLYIVRLEKQNGDPKDGPSIGFGRAKDKVLFWRRVSRLDGLTVGEPVTAYRFGDDYYLPQFDWFPAWGKFVFLRVGLFPVYVAIGILWYKRRAKRAKAARNPS